jgi:bile acid:Na+ symporter, BASS family
MPPMLLAATAPSDDSFFAIVLLPIALAVIMTSLGLSLTVADFKRLFVFPKGVAIGMTNLVLISPLLAFGIAELYDLSPELAVGLVLMGAAPGGTTANLMTHLARGDTALSVTMTAISSLAAVITVPLYLGLSIEYFDAGVGDDVSMGGIVARVFAITIIPLAFGMWLRSRNPARADGVEPTLKKVAFGFLIVVIAGAVISDFGVIEDNFADLALATLTLNLAAMTVSFTLSQIAGLSPAQSTAIALELGIHNGTLAIAVASTIDTTLATPAAVYSLFMFLTAGVFARVMYRRNGVVTQPA